MRFVTPPAEGEKKFYRIFFKDLEFSMN